MELSRLTVVAINAALAAGELLRKGFGSQFDISSKPGPHNLVTQYDHKAEEIIISHIKHFFPDHDFLAEESGAHNLKEAPVLWVIDPLDGTTNFAHTIPLFAVSIGAVINNDVKVGVIYLPMMNELYVAEKGQGASLNGVKLSVSKVKVFQHAVVAMGFPYVMNKKAVRSAELFLEISRKGNPIRDLGSAAVNLAYLAAGRLDAFWNASLQPWDLAAGKLLVEEAGGKITQYDNSPLKVKEACTVVGTNGYLHDELLQFLRN
jgi:myo-inositol-1(or 4)-monophosphatase